ncbi:Bug family tripartite tricarboxylate transporter substrate binding protein [Comamonas suwonensis]|uniref:Bug family tripartite tricarboxylate transporter substrate binding protein n=1 Tax=Comamonas suwonensis TaxID=2606214 RepID=UPI00145D81C6|nr:tripartite tricarboxylate transporter substrate binding protein [Comamonas suwonensis]MBI1623761.1 tripartite tricarboxylate transporter substrate binding protein [Comamonas suwonensis]
MFRQILISTAVIASTGLSFSAAAQDLAKDYPNKPVRMIVPFPPGGGTDILSRVIASKLTEVSKWSVVPDNRAGAGGTIGITEAVKSAPTGYDMVMGQKDNVVLGPYLYKSLPWNPTRDLTPVAHVAYTPIVIATAANSPYKTLADVVAAAKKNPSKITYGSPGNGTSIHLAGVMLEKAAGIQLTHVPYKGSNPAMMDALSGNVDLLVSSVPSAIGQIKAGKMRAIAVTSAARSTSLPETPTLAESGLKGFNVSTWYGIFMPRNTPTPIVNKVNAEVNKLLAMPEVKEAILTQGAEPKAMSVQAFEQFFQSDFKANKAIVEASGASIQ